MTDEELAAFRRGIDKVDAELVRLLAERFRITHDIGVYKAANDMPPVDLVRQHQQVDGLRRLASSEGLDPDFCERFVHFVMDEVIRNHRRIAETSSEFTLEQETL
ncbi:chorismate mutase [Candidatus Poriferisodalis sp.]|uniref:chorismate mutase n=1 Tax=Candidatus Poriferisodalis sp. TaxID=3101277 RepID=UPI003B5180F7